MTVSLSTSGPLYLQSEAEKELPAPRKDWTNLMTLSIRPVLFFRLYRAYPKKVPRLHKTHTQQR